MGGAVSAGVDNDELVDNLKGASYITTPLLERVFRAVDRGDYFTPENREQAYRDNAWKRGNLHLSAPCIYAKVMEGLQLAPGHSFLNLGSGTGYLSTMAGLIIGPYGVNHGVELHADVLKYGLDRLEQFKKSSPAIDAFTFCDPQFVQGNCLCLSPDVCLYDRVYCGASCPDSHQQYMKSLIKPGGVLVMPINDQLVKMTRRDADTWDTVVLLPVSFSSLAMPDPSYPPATVHLPTVEPPDLQEMCRHQLRSILRTNIELEHPTLPTAANRTIPRPGKARHRRQFPRIVVPYVPVPFYESDDDAQMSDDDTEDMDRLFEQQPHDTLSQFSAFVEMARRMSRRQEREGEGSQARQEEEEEEEEDEDDDDEEEEEDVELEEEEEEGAPAGSDVTPVPASTAPPAPAEPDAAEGGSKEAEQMVTDSSKTTEEEPVAVAPLPQSDPIPVAASAATSPPSVKSSKKREKFDSGVGDEIENGKGPSSESEPGEDGEAEMEVDSSDSDYWDSCAPRTKVTRLLDPDDPNCPCNSNCSEMFRLREKRAGKGYKHKEGGGTEAEDGAEEEEGGGAEERSSPSATETYSLLMREKINLLPLPQALKLYLNYNREL